MFKDTLTYTRRKRAMELLSAVSRHLFLLGVSYVVLYPVLYMLSNAFKPVDQYWDPGVVWIPKSFTLETLYLVSLIINFGEEFLNTAIISLFPAVISTMTCMVYGYGLATYDFRGKKLVLLCLFLTIIIPQEVIATSKYAIFAQFDVFGILELLHIPRPNLIGTAWVNILPAIFGMGLKNGLFIFIYMQFFSGFPKELHEAAALDGSGPFRTFSKIVVPTARNINISVLLLSVVWNWNDYYTPAMFIRTRDTIAVALDKFKEHLDKITSMGVGLDELKAANTQLQAACLVTIVPMVILYIILQRRFAEGIENSGLTGM